jgi:hypothetical protein
MLEVTDSAVRAVRDYLGSRELDSAVRVILETGG